MRRSAPWRALGDERGATVVEFSLVVTPFLMLIFAIIEAGLNLFAASSLNSALRASTRQVQTGAVHAASMSQEEYRLRLCSFLPSFMECDRVRFDLRPISLVKLGKNADAGAGAPDPGSLYEEAGKFCPGGPGDYMLAIALFELPNMFSLAISRKVSTSNGDVYVVEAARTFRNEPFKAGAGGSC